MDFFLGQALSVFGTLFDDDPILQHPIIAVAPVQMKRFFVSKMQELPNIIEGFNGQREASPDVCIRRLLADLLDTSNSSPQC